MNPKHFDAVFSADGLAVENVGDVRFEIGRVGNLVVPTGSLVACDPFCFVDHVPLRRAHSARRIPCGCECCEG